MAKRIELEQTAFLYGGNGAFIEDLYARYLQDPADRSIRAGAAISTSSGPTPARCSSRAAARCSRAPPSRARRRSRLGDGAAVVDLGSERSRRLIVDHLRVVMLIRAYRVRGHLLADLDPLGLAGDKHHPELDPKAYGFTDADLDREFFLDNVLGLEKATLRQIVEILRQTYCATHRRRVHAHPGPRAEGLDPGAHGGLAQPAAADRRGQEGDPRAAGRWPRASSASSTSSTRAPSASASTAARAAIPALEAIIRRSAELGVDEIVIGMPHRGRLNVLANIMGKPYPAIFAEFQGGAVTDEVLGSGDVKYHLGTSTDRDLPDGREVHLSLTANPSHLEAVNPVVLGKVRAKQTAEDDTDAPRVMGLLLHGDAAFAGQGVVHEGFEMSELRGFRTGGTVHLIVNNQIGFTTEPGLRALVALPLRRRAQRPGADLPRQRRRPRGRGPRRAARRRVPAALQEGRGDRPLVLPAPRPQRGRRADASPSR